MSSLQYRGEHAWNDLSVDARDYSLEKFNKYLAGTVCNYHILVYIYTLIIFYPCNSKFFELKFLFRIVNCSDVDRGPP